MFPFLFSACSTTDGRVYESLSAGAIVEAEDPNSAMLATQVCQLDRSPSEVSTSCPATAVLDPSSVDVVPPECLNFQRQFSPLCDYADKEQTMIIFDFDDTIFPTTYLRTTHSIDFTVPLEDQEKDAAVSQEIQEHLQRSVDKACALLTLAASMGNVMILTLAMRPWVSQACKTCATCMQEVINSLGVTVVYAREFGADDVAPNQMFRNKINKAWVRYWTLKKAAAISAHLDKFYSQYQGQSWKNVISIGDSEFERDGTEAATSGYLEKLTSQESMTAIVGVVPTHDADIQFAAWEQRAWRHRTCDEVDTGEKILKLRAKTIKLVELPEPDRLCAQMDMVAQLIPPLVSLDSGIDIDLDLIKSETDMQDLMAELEKPGLAMRKRSPIIPHCLPRVDMFPHKIPAF